MTTDLTAQEIDELKRLHQVPLNVPNARYDFSMAAYRLLPRLLGMVERLKGDISAMTSLDVERVNELATLRRQIAECKATLELATASHNTLVSEIADKDEALRGVQVMRNSGALKELDREPWLDRVTTALEPKP